MEVVSTSIGKFTVDLFNKLNETNKGKNLFFSPWSISAALALTHLGAKGNTATEMAEDLENKKAADIHSGFEKLLTAINKPRSTYSLRSANRIYVEKTFLLLPTYIQLSKNYYKAEPQKVNFKTAPEQSGKEINAWVEKQTEGKIKNLLSPRDVSNSTKLILVNAIYFKAEWEVKFQGEHTDMQAFRLSKNKTKPVKMMYMRNTFPVLIMETMNFKMIELPYVKRELSMFILLPDDIKDNTTGLEQLERELTYEKLSEWTDSKKMTETFVDLYLPKFKMEERYDLSDNLVRMGMRSAFSSNADFSGMTEKGDLQISKVFHKSFVAVDEKGTEAAAATAVIIELTSAPVGHVLKFKVDHPFFFFIRHNKSKSILFFGVPAKELIFNRCPKGYSERTIYKVQLVVPLTANSVGPAGVSMESLSVSTNSFTLDLYKKLNENSKGQNIFFSPWSIATALAMVHLGAKGDTATQMAEDPEHGQAENIHSGFKKLLSAINKRRSTYLLKSANRLYEEKTYPLLPTKTKPVQMMFLRDKFFVFHETTMKFRIIELPYVENELSMFVLLPDDISDNTTGLELVERELTYEKLAEWTKSANMMKAEVDLYLPKLKLEENYDLKSPLSSMGIRNAFDPVQADFTGMSAKKDLFISQVIHKAFVEVNEEGTEAAAATGVLVMRSKAPTMTFKADHPFLFFIRHNKSQTILFFGRLCSP
ncbi:hypothetical protein BTVI_100857 [Pitangus sulphuratus]|nr:hypothetical protein BTVI_100857 [Pitangus sulphuratus]